MGLISPGGENLLDFLELRQVLLTYDGDLRDPLWWLQERPVHHVGQSCGKASWESLMGKPRGKAPDPLIPGKGRVTLLLQLERKSHVHAPTRDED